MASFADKVMSRYTKGGSTNEAVTDDEDTGEGAGAEDEEAGAEDEDEGSDGMMLCKAIEKKDGAAIEAAVRRICDK